MRLMPPTGISKRPLMSRIRLQQILPELFRVFCRPAQWIYRAILR